MQKERVELECTFLDKRSTKIDIEKSVRDIQ